MFLRNEGPQLLTVCGIDRMHVAVIGCRVYDDLRVRLGAAVNDGRRARVQGIAHRPTHRRRRIEVLIGDIFSASKANQLIDVWLSCTTRQTEIR